MALTIGELVGYLRIDAGQFTSGLAQAKARFGAFAAGLREEIGKADKIKFDEFRAVLDHAAASGAALAVQLARIPAAASAISGSASVLGEMSGALGVLPAVGAAAAAGMVAVKLGMDGFGDAMKAMDDPEKFAKKLEALSPAARETALAARGLKPAWESMQNAVQEKLFSGIAGQLKQLGSNYLPVLKSGLGGIAAGFNTAAKETGAFLNQSTQVSTVNGIFANLTPTIGNVSSALRPIVQILLDVVAVGSEMLPDLTGGFGGAAQSAADFVRHARETGKLKEWMSTGLSTIGDLWHLLTNVASILGTVFSGLNSGGGGLLKTLITITDQVRVFLRSVEGQQALKALGAALGEVSRVVSEVAIAAFRQLAPVITKAAPGFAELARQVGTVLVDAINIAGPILSGLAGFITKNADWLGPMAIGIYGVVKAVDLWRGAATLLNTVLYLNPWTALIGAVGLTATFIISKWDEISAFLSETWQWISDRATEIWGWIERNIVDPAVRAATWIGDRFAELGRFLADTWQWISDRASAVWGWIERNIVDPISSAADWVGRRIADIVDVFEWLGSLPGRVAGWFGAVYDGAVGKMGELADWLGGLPDRILGAIGDAGTWLLNIGRDLIEGLWTGIKNAGAWLGERIKNFFLSLIPDWLKDVFGIHSPSKLMADQVGRWIPLGVVEGIESTAGLVAKAVRALDVGAGLSFSAGRSLAPVPVAAAQSPGRGSSPPADEGRTRATVHVEHFHATPTQQPRDIARELDWLSRGGG